SPDGRSSLGPSQANLVEKGIFAFETLSRVLSRLFQKGHDLMIGPLAVLALAVAGGGDCLDPDQLHPKAAEGVQVPLVDVLEDLVAVVVLGIEDEDATRTKGSQGLPPGAGMGATIGRALLQQPGVVGLRGGVRI